MAAACWQQPADNRILITILLFLTAGAEGMVFGPKSDMSWLPAAKAISLEVHE